jgi:hypothetical protein
MNLFYCLIISSSWYTSTRGLLIAAVSLLVLAVIIILPTVLGVLFTRNPLGRIKPISMTYAI